MAAHSDAIRESLAQQPALTVVVLALSSVLWAMAVLLREYYRLKVTPAIVLNSGNAPRSAATTKENVARLQRFLEEYPLDEPALLRFGFKADDNINGRGQNAFRCRSF